MKNLIKILVAALALTSCKEEEKSNPAFGNICVINMVTDAGAVLVNASGQKKYWSSVPSTVAYGARAFCYAPEGQPNLVVVPAADTTKVLFIAPRTIKSKVYTMYLSGTKAAVDTMFKEEINLPFIFTDSKIPPSADSVVNIRFVNLSVGSPALKVKLTTNATNEVDNLPYKGVGSWKAYPAKLATTAYSFQIRRVDTDALITTYSFSATATNRFKNVALVIRGVFGTTTGTAPFGVSAINYF